MMPTAADFGFESRPRARWWSALAGLGLVLGGCADVTGLHARMNDDEVRAVVQRELEPGMTLVEVHQRLDGLRVSGRYRMHYPPTESRPEVLLVRMFDGGFWVDAEHDVLKWLDLSLVFEEGRYDRALLYRDRVEYFDGDPIRPPTRPAAGPMRYFPGAIPPPVDPLEGAE